jgi:hypothetical protein
VSVPFYRKFYYLQCPALTLDRKPLGKRDNRTPVNFFCRTLGRHRYMCIYHSAAVCASPRPRSSRAPSPHPSALAARSARLHKLVVGGQSKGRSDALCFEMHRSLTPLKHLSQLLLFRSPSFCTMSTTTSVDPFANSCSQLDKLIKRLESDLGVQEPFDVKKAMSAQAAPAAVAPAAPQKAAATIGASGAAAAAAASGGAPAQDAAAKPKKEKVDKPAAAPKAPPVRRCVFSCCSVLFLAGRCHSRHRKD